MKPWYTLVNRADVNDVLHFMNYGYHSDDDPLDLDKTDEPERYCIQLYHHLASLTDVRGKALLEVGCGRGGGLSYVKRYLEPASAHGVDINPEAIAFCRRTYEGISFDVMDAEDLDFPDSSFDVVMNVESSHRYPHFVQFAREVHRVLRPGGTFVLTDFRPAAKIDEALEDLRKAGFQTLHQQRINDQVVAALKIDRARRVELIEQFLPRLLRRAGFEFAGIPGTKIYNSLERGTRTYLSLALVK